MEKTNTLSNKIYLNNILRNIMASGAGFVFCWIMFSSFYAETREEILLAGFGIFMIFAGLFFYTAVLENVLFFLMKRKGFLPVLITNSTLIVLMMLVYSVLDRAFSLEIVCLLIVFISAQIVGFKYQNLRQIKKGKNWTV
ncbi:hypothetical protein [Chryseobacterium caseinilyticum]|uniref:Uncharacterized protein n=1 Tax=Chryseobacterium caseinilyticum TaxID=2771428 RepID=A0ABR8ZGP6_9FLAO|nr:hypothetical protein [Chryseobacterium caseinilyticum]MBD8084459.1 hypothetical protein [Chryseobacterium caseinilyticum]